jgi:gentisate 1,2-dioxygenase
MIGSSWQVFDGEAVAEVGGQRFEAGRGDLFAVPSWAELTLTGWDGRSPSCSGRGAAARLALTAA